jgi:hypothetical protein
MAWRGFLVALLLQSGLPARADTIHLIDGSSLEDVEVLAEQLDGVSYRRKGRSGEERLDAERVLSIERERLRPSLEQAERLVERGAIGEGIAQLLRFAATAADAQLAKQDWAVAHALDRALRLQLAQGELGGAIETANLLQAQAPQSRHVPPALLAKAQAQRALGDAPGAQATLDELRDLIVARRLAARWSLELDLARLQGYPELPASARRDRLAEIADQSGSAWPPVRNRARLLAAESYLASPTPDFAKAGELFAEILAEPIAEDETLARAHAGLSDCQLHAARQRLDSGADATADLRAALLSAMRVVVLYPEQAELAAKCMFLAARACELLGDEASKADGRRLLAALLQRHPGSKWAALARESRQ